MSNRIKIVVPCDEAHHVCDKTQYNESTFWEKMMLLAHLVYCRACRRYVNRNRKLSGAIRKAKVKCLDKKSKDAMKLVVDRALKDQLK